MSTATGTARPTPSAGLAQRWRLLRRRGVPLDIRLFAGLALTAVVVTLLVAVAPDRTPFTTLMIPLLVASLLLSPRYLMAFVSLDVVLLSVSLSLQDELTARVLGAAVVQYVMCAIVLATSLRRLRLGVAGVLGESMFVDLRDRILDQGSTLTLPAGWYAESALRSAGGTAFAGDFLVSARPSPTRLEVAVVDVSGKGEQAGTRALLLSGAFGGLLGALPPARFLPAANDYLLRQDWDEGFATAIHLSLDLATGAYEIRSAGHPPAALRTAGSGRWSVLGTEGPVLGLIDGADFTCAAGVLRPGDTVLLYTDGMVEEPRRDIEMGIDRMLGEAESQLRGNHVGAARRLVEALGSHDDDRAMLVLTRV